MARRLDDAHRGPGPGPGRVRPGPCTPAARRRIADHPVDGATHNVLDRIVRASLRKGAKRPPDLIEPGEEYEYTIPLGNAGTIFRKGHRVRLEISSSSFPHYAPNLNTGKNSNWTSDLAVASQTILHSARHPSRLVLIVAPGVRAP